ncbi:hypothetical protein [Sphingobacterium sp. SYP-B4668]|uniref:hypothetical protein n=1 Tax=Sphingobacterium sp. SYP-B4668 TaxID=2996035 RepID=UPI0005324BF8|nr:hypothetical protein [Sphingobacterium sp. SYP-B4668]
MRHTLYSFLLLLTCLSSYAAAQTKEDLKKKYENSDLHKETEKKMRNKQTYPDSIILAPLHFTNSFVNLDSNVNDFQSFSIDVEIQNNIPDDYAFYISPFNISLNGIPIYGGIQTHSDGHSVKDDSYQQIGRGGIFSRWYERNKEATRTHGYYNSSDGEGDFISVRNKVNWNKGKYRLKLTKAEYIPGKSIADKFSPKDLYFAWGDMEHTWVTYTVENLDSKKVDTIGSLAFPGKKLTMSKTIIYFTEQYHKAFDFAATDRKLGAGYLHYKKIPTIDMTLSNLKINETLFIPREIKTHHNRTHHPDQDQIKMPMPILSIDRYDASTGILTYCIGRLVHW